MLYFPLLRPTSAEHKKNLAKAAGKRYYLRHKSECAQRNLAWALRNPERVRAIRKKALQKRYVKHRAKILAQQQEYRKQNQSKIVAWRQANKQYWQEWARKNRVRIQAKARIWRAKNAGRIRAMARSRYRLQDGAKKARERRQRSVIITLKSRLRCRINVALRNCRKGLRKCDTTLSLLGCSYDELKQYCESLFTKGMTWDAVFDGRIHLDHVKPCASFDLTNVEEQNQCFHFSNLRPMWARDNLIKGARLPNGAVSQNVSEFRVACSQPRHTSRDLRATRTSEI